jgi:hypothetical protein
MTHNNNENNMKTAKEIYLAAAEYAYGDIPRSKLRSAMDACEAAYDAWLASDEERDWQVGGESWGDSWIDRWTEVCPSDIAKKLRKNCLKGDWDNEQSTMWVSDWALPINPVTNEPIDRERVDVTTMIEANEPSCDRIFSEHDWQSPHEVVGGCEENPGVHGHGGGVIITGVCAHCGKYKITDTWAQNPETGEQGLTSVEYEDADERSEQWLLKETK